MLVNLVIVVYVALEIFSAIYNFKLIVKYGKPVEKGVVIGDAIIVIVFVIALFIKMGGNLL